MRKYIEVKTVNSLNKIVKNYSLKEEGSINKSAIIESIIAEVPLPLIVLNRTIENSEDIIKEILLGKNEVIAIKQFLNDEFALKNDCNLSLKGLTFSELPENIQDDILDESVAIVTYYNIEDNTKEILIDRFTSIKNTNEVEKEELSEVDKYFNSCLEHEFFDRVNINPLSNDIITQIYMLIGYGAIELSSRRINKFKEKLEGNIKLLDSKNDDLDKIEEEFNERLDFLADAFTDKTNYLKKAHLPIIFLCVCTAVDEGISSEKFKEIMDKFFMNLDNHKKYKEAGSSHTTSKKNVEIRINELTSFFNKEIK